MKKPAPFEVHPPFAAAYAKIARARAHIAELSIKLGEFAESEPAKVTVDYAEDGKSFNMRMDFTKPPIELSAIIGDSIHNARASLDLMASDIVKLAGHTQIKAHFPFAEKPEDLDQQIKNKKFNHAGKEPVALLKSFAPYRGGNFALRAMHELDIEDKHEAILIAAISAASPAFFFDMNGKIVTPFGAGDKHSVSDLKFVFAPGNPFAEKEIIPTLKNLVELAEGIIKAFDSLSATIHDRPDIPK